MKDEFFDQGRNGNRDGYTPRNEQAGRPAGRSARPRFARESRVGSSSMKPNRYDNASASGRWQERNERNGSSVWNERENRSQQRRFFSPERTMTIVRQPQQPVVGASVARLMAMAKMVPLIVQTAAKAMARVSVAAKAKTAVTNADPLVAATSPRISTAKRSALNMPRHILTPTSLFVSTSIWQMLVSAPVVMPISIYRQV